MQIIYANAVRWVTAKYLARSRPTGIPTSWRTVERGLQPNAVRVHRAARSRFPSILTYYGGGATSRLTIRLDAHWTSCCPGTRPPPAASSASRLPAGAGQRTVAGHQVRDLGPEDLEHPA